jgi:hypothetical protein
MSFRILDIHIGADQSVDGVDRMRRFERISSAIPKFPSRFDEVREDLGLSFNKRWFEELTSYITPFY